MRLSLIPLALLALAACASNGTENTSTSEASRSAVDQTTEGLPDAALSPLEDLNLRREPIPDLLKGLQTPYFAAGDMSCSAIALEIDRLSSVLGIDWDLSLAEIDEETDPDTAQWAADKSADAALGTVRSTTQGFIPFRGLVREATGAASHAAKLQKAYRIGGERRAYLKGYGQARGCDWPAAPLSLPDPEPFIQFRGDRPNG